MEQHIDKKEMRMAIPPDLETLLTPCLFSLTQDRKTMHLAQRPNQETTDGRMSLH